MDFSCLKQAAYALDKLNIEINKAIYTTSKMKRAFHALKVKERKGKK